MKVEGESHPLTLVDLHFNLILHNVDLQLPNVTIFDSLACWTTMYQRIRRVTTAVEQMK